MVSLPGKWGKDTIWELERKRKILLVASKLSNRSDDS